MDNPADELVSHLTKSLHRDSEHHLATSQVLHEAFRETKPETAAQELSRFKNLPANKIHWWFRQYRSPILLSISLVIVLALASPSLLRALNIKKAISGQITSSESHFNSSSEKRNSEDPAALALHLLSEQDKTISSHYFETAAQIDPTNAFFPLLEAAQTLKSSTKRNPAYPSRKSKTVPKRIIHDPARFEEGFRQLKEASLLPNYQSYSRHNISRRLELLPPEVNLQTRITRLVAKAGARSDFSLLTLPDILQLQLQQAEANKDIKEIRALFDLSIALSRLYSQQTHFLPENLIQVAYLKKINQLFTASKIKKHLTERQKAQLSEITLETTFHEDLHDDPRNKIPEELLKGAGVFTKISTPILRRYSSLGTPLTDKDFKPERQVWQAILERLAVFLFAALFLSLAGGLTGKIKKKKGLSQIAHLFSQTSTTRSLVGASLLITSITLLNHLLWTRFTPFGAPHQSWAHTRFTPQIHHLIALVILTTILATNTARLISRQRLAHFNLIPPLSLWSWWPAPLAILSYPLSSLHLVGITLPFSKSILPILLAILASWLFSLLYNFFKSPAAHKLAAKLSLAYASLLFVFLSFFAIFAIPLLEIKENYWLNQDNFNTTNQHQHGLNRLEHEITLSMHQRWQTLHLKIAEIE